MYVWYALYSIAKRNYSVSYVVLSNVCMECIVKCCQMYVLYVLYSVVKCVYGVSCIMLSNVCIACIV